MLQGHIYFLFVKENATQEKGAHQRERLSDMRPEHLY